MFYQMNYKGKKPKKWAKIVLPIAFVLVVIILSIVLGNYLKRKTDRLAEDTLPMPDTGSIVPGEVPDIGKAKNVVALPLSIENAKTNWTDAAGKLAEASATGASIRLTGDDGKILYQSRVTSELGDEAATADRTDLAKVADALHAEGIRVIADLDLPPMDDDILGDARRAYQIALVNELGEFGVDEVLLFGASQEDETIAILAEFLEKSSKIESGIEIGLVLPFGEVRASDTALEALLAKVDFLAVRIDLGPEEDDEAIAERLGALFEDNAAVMTRYSPRVVFGNVADTQRQAAARAAADAVLGSWQISDLKTPEDNQE